MIFERRQWPIRLIVSVGCGLLVGLLGTAFSSLRYIEAFQGGLAAIFIAIILHYESVRVGEVRRRQRLESDINHHIRNAMQLVMNVESMRGADWSPTVESARRLIGELEKICARDRARRAVQ